MAPYGHFWAFFFHAKVPFVGILKLCQKMSDTMKNKSGHFNHIILRKRWKYGQNIDDFIYFYFFLKTDCWIELIPVQTSYGRGIEYMQGILWKNFVMAIFDQTGHFLAIWKAILAKISFITKPPFVGTLELLQEMPDIMQNKFICLDFPILTKRWK